MGVYCGVDLHARSSQVCVIVADGKVLVNRKVPNWIEDILRVLEPFGTGIPVSARQLWRRAHCG